MRIFSIPLLIGLVWSIYNVVCTNADVPVKNLDGFVILKIVALSILTVMVGMGILFAWIDIPERERKILDGVEE
jgi:hypothetical protein